MGEKKTDNTSGVSELLAVKFITEIIIVNHHHPDVSSVNTVETEGFMWFVGIYHNH